jgi:NMD protein affecting ribosome stability and mRNA decay
MGTLGHLEHVVCRNCGMQWSRKAELPPEEPWGERMVEMLEADKEQDEYDD